MAIVLILASLLASLGTSPAQAQPASEPHQSSNSRTVISNVASASGAARPLAAAPLSRALPTDPILGYHLNLRGGFDYLASFTVPDAQLATVVGAQTANIYGMDFDGETLWGLNQDTLQLGVISTATATFSATHTLSGIPSGQSVTGFTIAADGTFLVLTATTGANMLSQLDPTTGVLTPIGQIANAVLPIAMAINCENELYVHDISLDSILRAPRDNPAGAVVLGPTGQNTNFAQGMDFDDTTNTLYGWLYRGSGNGDFARIDTDTGAATVITPLVGEFEGAIRSSCPPDITSPVPPDGTYGVSYLHTVTASDRFTTTLSLAGTLPPGLQWDAHTSSITGTPTLAGTYPDLQVMASYPYSAAATQSFTITIAPASQTIQLAALPDQVYSANPVTPQVSATSGLPISLSAGTGDPCTASGTSISLLGVGTCTITATQAGDVNYLPAMPVSTTFTITPAPLTVSGITAPDRPYDGTTATTLNLDGASLSGLIGTDTVTLDISNATGTFVTKDVGVSKVVTVSGLALEDADASNYTLLQPTTTASITARALTVSAIAQQKVAGAPDPVLTYALTAGDLVTGESLTGALSRSPGEAVGTYAIQQGTLQASQNYTLSFLPANLTITRAATSLELSTTRNPAAYATPITITAKIRVVAPGAGQPTGVVTFTVNGLNQVVPVAPDGTAVFSSATLPVGTHSVSAVYSGDTELLASSATLAGGQVITSMVEQTRLYLPLISSPAPLQGPDLVVEAIRSEGGELEVVIANVGDQAVVHAFWVDLAIAPRRPPAAPNDTWEIIGQRGAAWGVTTSLAPGARLTLSLGDRYYRADESDLGGAIDAGAQLYAHVDSADTGTTYGRVREDHELSGERYNNVTSALTSSAIVVPSILPAAPSDGQLER